uniref:Calcineurin-like phosphoesterase domain-containing protein n=1 Tax=viral metagenome TaxID=1070528 RepID=A0A6C0LTK3_9ZZZZ
MQIIECNSNINIKYIYHISDIHIRNIQRHREYKNVFEKTYTILIDKINNKQNESLIVLTGDIMHSKTELSPEAIDLASNLFISLSKIAPVILIAGNHDCIVSNQNRMDALTPIVNNINLDNFHYLKMTGFYQYNNIIFGYTDMYTDILLSSENIIKNTFNNIEYGNKYKIALFHGIVRGSVTDMGFETKSERIRAKDFRGYDFVLLGDIHKYQYLNPDKTIAYAGSLIQQSHGETLNNHGILRWNLETKQSKLLEIENDYGYCTVKIINGKMNQTIIPKYPNIKFIIENTTSKQFQIIEKELNEKYKIGEIIKENIMSENLTVENKNSKLINTDHEEFIISYLDKKLLKKKSADILKLHKVIRKKTNNNDNDESNTMQEWKILKLKFTNMLSYGKNNVIDFRKYKYNQIIGIVAPNHYGKSAILDIILFCLFEKCSRGNAKEILNKNKNDFSCSLLLNIGSKEYLIERIGKRSKNKLLVNTTVNFITFQNDNEEKLNGVTKSDTNQKIIDLVGLYDDYLITCICIQQQGKHGNFIDMTHLQKKEYLYDILKLNIFDKCFCYAKEQLKKYTTNLKNLKKDIDFELINNMKKNISAIKSEMNIINNRRSYLHDISNVLNFSIQSKEKPSLIQYHELSNYQLDTHDDILNVKKILSDKINHNDIININQKIVKLQNNIFELKLINDKFDKNYIEYNNELEKLYSQIIKIPIDINNLDLDKLKNEFNSLNLQITCINKKLSVLKKNITNKSVIDIKEEIVGLRKKIKYIDPDCENQLKSLMDKLHKLQQQLFNIFVNNGFTNFNVDQLKYELKFNEKFAIHVHKTIKLLNSCNKENISNALNVQDKWLNNFNIWKNNVINFINNNANNKSIDIDYLLNKLQLLNKKMIKKSVNVINHYSNIQLNSNIDKLECLIDNFREFDDFKFKKDMLFEKLNIINDQINHYQCYRDNDDANIIINNKIKQLKKHRDSIHLEKSINISKIDDLNKNINDYQDLVSDKKNHIKNLWLLEFYELYFYQYTFNKKIYDYYIDQQNIINLDLEKLNAQYCELDKKIAVEQNKLDNCIKLHNKYNNYDKKCSLYKSYCNVMDFNGIPYEILKSVLPQIENKVNQTLHNMANFNIEFLFYDDSFIAEKKIKNSKSNIGTININICYADQMPYNVQLASGFEKFIIGLAIRIVLCHISKTAKPNFFIVDEGWSCLDGDNLSNIDVIMNYIKNQFDHVIIISHLEELKNQADNIINITKKNAFSHTNNLI